MKFCLKNIILQHFLDIEHEEITVIFRKTKRSYGANGGNIYVNGKRDVYAY